MTESPTSSHVARFEARFGGPPLLAARAPGRVNLLGAHVDHQQGWVLPGAIDRAVEFVAAPRDDGRLLLAALDLERQIEVDLDRLPPPVGERREPRCDWFDVALGVAWACRREGLELRGLNVAFGGDLPIGAGVSSSAAVEVGLLLLWDRLGQWRLEPPALARLGRRAENRYLGVGSGIMDQLASLCGRADHLLLLDCRSLSYELLPFGYDHRIVVFDSGVRRRLTDVDYNRRREECAEALATLRGAGFRLDALRDLPLDELARATSFLAPTLARRTRHVVEECDRVLRAAEHLRRGDLAAVGALMTASHASSRDLFEVSIPQLDLLVDSAAAEPACCGARLSGAGFGGCVTALVGRESVAELVERVGERYASAYGEPPESFSCRIGDGAAVRRRP